MRDNVAKKVGVPFSTSRTMEKAMKHKTHKARRVDGKKFIKDAVGVEDDCFIPCGGTVVYRQNEVLALEHAKLMQECLEIQIGHMRQYEEGERMLAFLGGWD